MAPWWLRAGSDDPAQDNDPETVLPTAESFSQPESTPQSGAAEADRENWHSDQETEAGPRRRSRRRRRRRRAKAAPEAAASETAASETVASETVASETAASETAALETVASETVASEAVAPEAAVPETKAESKPTGKSAADKPARGVDSGRPKASIRDNKFVADKPKTAAAPTQGPEDVARIKEGKAGAEGSGTDETATRAKPVNDPSKAAPKPELRQQKPQVEDDGDDLVGDDSAETELNLESLSSKGHLVYAVPDRNHSMVDERKIAMFVDFENIALGVRASDIKALDVNLILERLLEKGKIIVKKAYADWERYSEFKRPFHEAAMELIDIPQKYYSGKNSADIKMVVDAMDLCYSKEHLDTFVLVSGDSDFSPLVSKLKENNKYVIGLGVKNSSSNLLVDNCDEFLYYEDIWRDSQRAPKVDHLPAKQAECFKLMSDAMLALFRENKDVLWGSMLKQTMKRKRPSFNEGYYGYGTFSELLEDAASKNLIRLRRDRRSGSYIVAGFVLSQKR